MISILKITKGNNSAKDTISILTIYKITKRHKTAKNVERVTVNNQSLVMLYISTKFCEIILNSIKVIERTLFLYGKLQRGIILQKIQFPYLPYTKLQRGIKPQKM